MSSCQVLASPPVGETMHFAGLCYCHLCNCGNHKCPNQNAKSEYLHSALASVYRKDYQKKEKIPIKYFLFRTVSQISPKNISFKRDLLSTHKSDFTYQPTKKTPSAKYEKDLNIGLIKCASSTCYQSQYPNWGNYQFIHCGKFERSATDRNVAFSPTTTYSDTFKEIKLDQIKSAKNLPHRSPIPGGDFDGLTINKKFFMPLNQTYFPKRAKNVDLGIAHLESPNQAYKTFYQREF